MVSQQDDQTAKQMLNSLRFKSSSFNKVKRWSPDISQEERFKMKRRREDDYVQEFNPEDRPILLIKQKDAYQNIRRRDPLDNDKDHYYKISQNTQLVDDIGNEIQNQDIFTKKNTIIHGKMANPDQKQQVYKIQGIEFLPEGFIELDPLLYKDQFEFESKIHENFFNEEQRRIKALRRKQYEQRNFQKMRDVTIYLLDERKNQIVEFLEMWYFKHKRRMNNLELEQNAQLLQCDLQTMKDLQNLFLEKQKYLNSEKLKQYLAQHGRIRDNKLIVPPSLKAYFVKKNNPYAHVKSRLLDHFKNEQEYPERQIKKLKSPFSKRIRETKSQSNIKSHSNAMRFLNQQFEINQRTPRNTLTDQKIEEAPVSADYNQYHQEHKNTSFKQEDQEYKLNKTENMFKNKRQNFSNNLLNENNEYNNLRMYFDTEVNKILSKIQKSHIKTSKEPYCEADLSKNKKFMNCKQVINHDSSKIVQNYKQNLLKESYKDIFKNTKKPEKKIVRQSKDYEKLNQKSLKPLVKKEFEETKIKSLLLQEKRKIDENIEKEKLKLSKQMEEDIKQPQKESVDNKSEQQSDEKSQLQVTQLSKISFNQDVEQTSYKRSTLINKEDDKNMVIQQKLQAIQVGNEYYYQIIEDVQKDDVRKVSVITKSDRGQILSIQKIDKDLITDNYTNYYIEENPFIDGDQRVTLVVENDKGKVVSLNTIRPITNSFLGIDNKEQFLQTGNFRKSFILERDLGRGQIKRVHILPNIKIFNKIYQQKIIEIFENQGKYLRIITVDEQSRIIFDDKIQDNKKSNHYYSIITSDLIDDQGIREIILDTKNEKGQTIMQHSFRQGLNDSQIQFVKKSKISHKPTLITKQIENNFVKSYSMPPLICGYEFIRQQVEEKQDDMGNKSLNLVTFNQSGNIIQEDKINTEKQGDEYYSEVVKDQIVEGKRVYTVVTRNDRGETVGVNKIRATINSVLGEEIYENFVKEAMNQMSLKKTFTQKGQKQEEIQLRPTVVGNQYYQQSIKESLNLNGKKSYFVITKTQDGQIVSKQEIDKQYDNEFYTEIQLNQENPDMVDLLTKNQKHEIISKVTLRPIFHQVLNQDYNQQFKHTKKSSIIKLHKERGNTIREQNLEPTQIDNIYYQQNINEIINQDGTRQVTLTTIDQLGNIIDIQDIDQNQDIENCSSLMSKAKRGISIVIKNEKGEIINQQIIDDGIQKYLDNIKKTTTVSQMIIKNENLICHRLRDILIGQSIIKQQIDEEIDRRNNKILILKTYDQSNYLLGQKILDQQLKGRNYSNFITKDFIDNEGIRKVILTTKNDRDEVLGEIEIRPDQKQSEMFYDHIGENQLQEKIIKINSDKKILKLRPTFIGNEYYRHIIEETVDSQGNKRLTMITYDDSDVEIGRQQIKNIYELEKISIEIENDEIKDQERYVTLKITDSHNNILAQQKLQTFVPGNLKEQNFSDFYDVYDKSGRKVNTISVRREKQQLFRSHSLFPLLVGSNYYQQVINEVIEDNGVSKGMVVTSDENGRVISQVEIPEEILGEFYRNTIKEDYIDDQNERIVVLDTLNNKDEVICSQKFKPKIHSIGSEQETKTVLETINSKGDKVIYYFQKKLSGQQRLVSKILSRGSGPMDVIYEEIENEDIQQRYINNNKYFNDLIKDLYYERDPYRFSDIKQQKKDEKKNTLLVKDFERKNKDSNEQTLEYLQETEKTILREDSQADIIESLKNSINLSTTKQMTMKESSDNIQYDNFEKAEELVNSNVQQQVNEQILESNNQEEIMGIFKEIQETREKSLDEHHDLLIEKSQKLKGYLDDYIQTLQKSKLSQLKRDQEKVQQEQFLKKTIEEVFEREKMKLGKEIVSQLSRNFNGQTFQPQETKQEDLMEEFYRFCKDRLPKDHNYKESIMFVSLFYYFMEKKNLIKK